MADNLDYLKSKVAEQVVIIKNLQTKVNTLQANYQNLAKKLATEMAYYSSLGALAFKKKKESEGRMYAIKAEQNAVKVAISTAKSNISKAEIKKAGFEKNIQDWLDAVNEGTSGGLKGDDAVNYAENETNDLVNDLKAEEQTEAQKLDNEKKKKVTNYILIGVILAIIIGVIIYIMKNKKSKK